MSTTNDKLADALRWALPLMSTPTPRSRAVCPAYAAKWDAANAALAAHAASIAAPPAQGEWVLVPRVPTEAMRDAGNDGAAPYMVDAAKLWAQMLAASPQPAPAPVPQDMLPERDPSLSDAEQGLYRKFDVRRTDGSDAPGGKHDGCEYFVLDLTHDEHAHAALSAYADACEREHPILAADLRSRYLPETCQDPEGYDEAAAQPPAPGEAVLPPLPKWDDVLQGRYLYTAMGHERMRHVETYATACVRAAIAALAQRRVPDAVRMLPREWREQADGITSAAAVHSAAGNHGRATELAGWAVTRRALADDLERALATIDQQQEARGNGE